MKSIGDGRRIGAAETVNGLRGLPGILTRLPAGRTTAPALRAHLPALKLVYRLRLLWYREPARGHEPADQRVEADGTWLWSGN